MTALDVVLVGSRRFIMYKRQMQVIDPDAATSPVVGIAETYGHRDVGPHAHRKAQLMFAVEGTLTVSTSDGSWLLPTNRALWIPGGQQHSIQLTGTIRLRTLYFDEQVDWVPIANRPTVINVSPLMRELIVELVWAPWDDDWSGSPSERIARALCDRLTFSNFDPMHLPALKDPRAQRLGDIYLRNPGERRPLIELATNVGASVRTLERIFRSETGMSPREWVQQFRLISALEQIAGGAPVSIAAFDVGFENPSSFIALFRRHFGTTPGRYLETLTTA